MFDVTLYGLKKENGNYFSIEKSIKNGVNKIVITLNSFVNPVDL